MFGGFTLATVFGVPLGAYLGLHIGWRETLSAVNAGSSVMLIFLMRGLPEGLQVPRVNLAGWLQLGRDKIVLLLLGVSLLQIGDVRGVWIHRPVFSAPSAVGECRSNRLDAHAVWCSGLYGQFARRPGD